MNYSGLFKRPWSIMWRYPSMALVVLIGTLLSLLLSFVLSPVLSPFAISASGSVYGLIVIQGALSLAITVFISGALISMVNSVLVSFLQTGSMLDAFTLSNQSSFNSTNALLRTGIFYFIFSLAVSLVIGAIGVGAERATALETRSVFAALKAGWNLLGHKLKDFIAIGLIFLLWVILLALTYFLLANLIGSALLGGIFVIISILFSIFAAVFVSGVWTLAFREWQAQERGELSVATE